MLVNRALPSITSAGSLICPTSDVRLHVKQHSLPSLFLLEDHGSCQADQVRVVLVVDVCKNGVFSLYFNQSRNDSSKYFFTHRWDLIWNLNIFGHDDLALLDWAFHVDILDLLAKIGFRVDEANQTVLDLQNDIGSIFYIFECCTDGFDGQDFASVAKLITAVL